MRIIVVGAGKVGFAIAAEAARDGHDITVIDSDPRAVERLSAALDVMALYGNGAALDVQREAGVAGADLLIAVTAQDELNMICCILARKLGCANTIARVRNPEYVEELYLLRRELGLSMTINPDGAAAREIFRLLQFPGFLRRESFDKSRVEIVCLALREGNALCGRTLAELPKLLKRRVLICAVQRGGQVTIPGGTFRLLAGDEVYFTAPEAELAQLLESVGLRHRRARDVMIVGGSRSAVRLTELLLQAGVNVKLIERERARCQYLAERLPGASVICADGTSQDVLGSENLSKMDAVVTLTNMDEENILISMYADSLGVPQTVTKINRTEYNALYQRCGIECTISPKDLCALEVLRYVRAMQNTSAERVLSMHYLVDGKAEALEFEVTEDTPHLNEKLSQLRLKPNILLTCITRNGRPIFPGGEDALRAGDTVVLVTAAHRAIVELGDIFAD